MNEQELFWAKRYAADYMLKNHEFNIQKGMTAWKQMLAKAEEVESILECGCNIGRNIEMLNATHPDAAKSVIEISEPAFNFVTKKYALRESFNGSIVESQLNHQYDLVFTCGVLIHIHPDYLVDNLKKMVQYSRRYILIAEYFNRTSVSLKYQGEDDKLFKSDYGRTFLKHFDYKCIDNGFLWGFNFDDAGFDDITWWLFEKK